MKKISILFICALIVFAVGCGKSEPAKTDGGNAQGTDKPVKSDTPVKLETFDQKASYALGQNVGNNMKNVLKGLDFDLVMQGLRDAVNGKTDIMSQQEMGQVLQQFQAQLTKRRQEERKKQAETNIAEGKAFLEKNGKEEGVVTTESGLQYTVMTEGNGPTPKDTDTVEVHYKGTTLDGNEFDSSYKRGTPSKFRVKGVISGWTEGLMLMKVGSKYKFFIPSDLGYGLRGSGPNIGPNATLVFEVELLSIVDPAAQNQPQKK